MKPANADKAESEKNAKARVRAHALTPTLLSFLFTASLACKGFAEYVPAQLQVVRVSDQRVVDRLEHVGHHVVRLIALRGLGLQLNHRLLAERVFGVHLRLERSEEIRGLRVDRAGLGYVLHLRVGGQKLVVGLFNALIPQLLGLQ